jgi:hypothetical protein
VTDQVRAGCLPNGQVLKVCRDPVGQKGTNMRKVLLLAVIWSGSGRSHRRRTAGVTDEFDDEQQDPAAKILRLVHAGYCPNEPAAPLGVWSQPT